MATVAVRRLGRRGSRGGVRGLAAELLVVPTMSVRTRGRARGGRGGRQAAALIFAPVPGAWAGSA